MTAHPQLNGMVVHFALVTVLAVGECMLYAPDLDRAAPALDNLLILVIDDDLRVRSMVRQLLSPHRVEAFEFGSQAIARAREQRFDAVFCDLMMPEMPGTRVFEGLTHAQPELSRRFTLMTGSPVDADLAAFLNRHGLRLLPKPFGFKQLADCLTESARRQVA